MTVPSVPPRPEAADPAEGLRVPEPAADASPPGARPIFSAHRAGLLASIACHAGLVLWGVGLWDSARPLAAMPPPSIAVDLVPAQEAPGEAAPPAPAPPPPPAAPPEPQDSAPLPDLLRPSDTANFSQRPSSSPDIPVPPDVPADGIEAKVALANRLSESLQLPVEMPGSEYEATPAEKRAKLTRNVVADFKAHVRKCWHGPRSASASPRLRVLIRVAFARNGALLKEPMLIQAVAAADGPALVKSAMKALQDCQPYAFLPPESYNEWKVMDIGFSPNGVL